jgi:hypothetical protein
MAQVKITQARSIISRPKDQKATRAVWGDSKGEAIFYGLAREATNQKSPAWMMIGNTMPMTGDIPRLQGRAAKQAQYALDAIASNIVVYKAPSEEIVRILPRNDSRYAEN